MSVRGPASRRGNSGLPGTQGGGQPAFVVSHSLIALLCLDSFPRNRQGRGNSGGGKHKEKGQPLIGNLQDKIWIKGFLWADKWPVIQTHLSDLSKVSLP